MPKLHLHRINTRDGVIGIYAPTPSDASRPLVVATHGARRSVHQLVVWAELLWSKADVALVDLPGHNTSSAFVPATLDRFAENVTEALLSLFPGRPMTLLGESLGGLVALKMATMPDLDLQGVIAADPPLTTVKQAQLQRAFMGFIEQDDQKPEAEFTRSLAYELFGYSPGQMLKEWARYDMLGAVRLPVDIITGDYHESYAIQLRAARCMIDDVDRLVVGQLYPGRVRFHIAPGAGHLVLEDQRDFCLAVILDRLANPTAAAPLP